MVGNRITGRATAYIAEEFRAQRGRLSLSIRDIERATGISATTITRALQGESTMAVETFISVCRALQLDAPKLIQEAEALG